MPDRRKTALLVGLEEATRSPMIAALTMLGYDISDTTGTIAIIMVRGGSTDEGVIAIAGLSCPVIAVVDAEDVAAVQGATAAGARGILDLPLRRSAIAPQIQLAISAAAYEQRMRQKVQLLERTLKARSIIEKATQLLATLRGITQHDAYEELRRTAMDRRISMADMAQGLVAGIEAAARSGPP